jgi:hypothetical protein
MSLAGLACTQKWKFHSRVNCFQSNLKKMANLSHCPCNLGCYMFPQGLISMTEDQELPCHVLHKMIFRYIKLLWFLQIAVISDSFYRDGVIRWFCVRDLVMLQYRCHAKCVCSSMLGLSETCQPFSGCCYIFHFQKSLHAVHLSCITEWLKRNHRCLVQSQVENLHAVSNMTMSFGGAWQMPMKSTITDLLICSCNFFDLGFELYHILLPSMIWQHMVFVAMPSS